MEVEVIKDLKQADIVDLGSTFSLFFNVPGQDSKSFVIPESMKKLPEDRIMEVFPTISESFNCKEWRIYIIEDDGDKFLLCYDKWGHITFAGYIPLKGVVVIPNAGCGLPSITDASHAFVFTEGGLHLQAIL